MSQNTVLVTGGASGIGRGLAEGFHERGNTVIIAGRREDLLVDVCAANPGMQAARLDVSSKDDIQRFVGEILGTGVNILVNNAGMMAAEDLTADQIDLDLVERTVATNLLGPIRLTAALLPHLQRQEQATIMNVTSGLGFVPRASEPTYSATKAALHSYTLSLRHQLRGTRVRVIEIIPPYVQTTLLNEDMAIDPRAMPLTAFIAETMRNFDEHPGLTENRVGQVEYVRKAEAENRFEEAFAAVNTMTS